VAYDELFHRGVNIIRGQNSSGKSTIVRFIFYVLGGCYGDFVPEALSCDSVMAEVCINGRLIITLKRYLEKREDGKVNGYTPMYLYYGSMDEALQQHKGWQKYGYKTTTERRSFSNVLFEIMGLPEFKADSNITMHQIMRLIYLDQESPLSSLFFFEQFDKEIIRETVSELLMGLYDQSLSDAKLERLAVLKKIDETVVAIKYTGDTLANPQARSVAFIQTIIDNLTKEIKANTELVQALRQKNAVISSKNEQLKREYERYQEEIAVQRKACVELETDIQQLKAELQDTQYFITALQSKIEAIERSMATRDYFDSLHLEYCPECLSKIEDNVEEGYCRLCKSPIDNSKGRSQAIRIRLELDFQIRESRSLMMANENELLEKEALLKAKKQQLSTAQEQYDNAVHHVRSTQDEQIDRLIQDIGYKEGDINQYRTMLEQAERYESLQEELKVLKSRDAELRKFITAAENRIEKAKRSIKRYISENGVYMLKNDQDRQTEFMNASDFEVDYKQNLAYISNQRIKLSASSEFYLKMAARFSLFFASLQVPTMMYPRLMFSDNMEDKGMEPDRAANFQRLVVKRLQEMPNQEYQLIFATSMIAPELDNPDFTIGDNYTRENKSLKNV
jgi:predicted  nucleic acid-binding Zn-ribbon protein